MFDSSLSVKRDKLLYRDKLTILSFNVLHATGHELLAF